MMLLLTNLIIRWREWRDWWNERDGEMVNLAAKKKQAWK